MKIDHAFIALSIVGGIAGTGYGQGDEPLYTMQALGGTGDDVRVYDINSSGVVCGWTRSFSGDRHGAIWIDGVLHALGTLDDDDSWEFTGINDEGHCVGTFNPTTNNPNDYIRAFRWIDANGDNAIDMSEVTVMHPAGTDEWSQASDISNGGQVCGILDYHPEPTTAFVNGSIVQPFESIHSESWAVNDSGVITGNYWSSGDEVWKAYRHSAGSTVSSGGLGGFVTQGNGINNAGHIVGWAYRPDWTFTGFLWLESPAYGLPAGFHEMPPSHENAWANDINETGTIVGYGFDAAYEGWALAWKPNGDGTFAQIDLQAVTDGVPDNWTFQEAMAVNDSGQIIVRADDGSGVDRAALLTPIPVDSDGDGLLDEWETLGIPYLDDEGVERRYILDVDGDGISDANPSRKDLFIEVDHMYAVAVSQDAMEEVCIAFGMAPVENPDGSYGITLHIVVDDDDLPFQNSWPVTGYFPTGFDAMKVNYFGTASERVDPNAAAMLEAKKKAYRYCIYCFRMEDGVMGVARDIWANDFVICYAEVHDVASEFAADDDEAMVEAALFMHELGHCLNLRHGGDEDNNHKPNYISVMNYLYEFPYDWLAPVFDLTYSRGGMMPLDEGNLDETVGFVDASTYNSGFPIAFCAPDCGIAGPCTIPTVPSTPTHHAIIGDGGVDLNSDGVIEAGACGDLNYRGSSAEENNTPSPCQVLQDHDDWSNLKYELVPEGLVRTRGGEPTCTLTAELVQEINASLPAMCTGDVDFSGAVDLTDLLAVIAGWGSTVGDPNFSGDANFDGTTDLADLLIVIANWGPCS